MTICVKYTYKRTKFTIKDPDWQPQLDKIFVSIALVHYKGKRTLQEFFEFIKVLNESTSAIVWSANQGSSPKKQRFDYSRVIKNITNIFALDPSDLTETSTSSNKSPKCILIEGAPGIGKTVLAKEIAYCWVTNEILAEIKILFLFYLRDPQLQSITTTKQLVEYMSMGSLNDEQIMIFSKYIADANGHQLCIVMDGLDESPTSLHDNSFFTDIVKGKILSEAIVVVTSRPTATVSLYDQTDRRIDILGLKKEERDNYISEMVSDSPVRKDKLDKYLKQHPGLCFVPLYLAILLYLFQQDSLPETLTEMIESFILHTIYQHLKGHGLTPSGLVDKLANVPKPVLDMVYKLSELAFKGLQENKLVFTFDEIKQTCPCIDETVGAINGYGLLQAVEHYSHKGAGTTKSFNFLHYTMQEFLAALHVSTLPSEQQLSLMKKTFWDGHYNFMWMMFVGIVGVKSDSFVNFVSKRMVYKNKSGIRMTENILSDKRKRLHTFQCYMEAKSSAEVPDVISSMFKDGKVIISGVKLLPHHLSSLMTFMSNSSTQWRRLELRECKITDIGMNVLEQFISERMSTLEYVDLSGNESSPWGVYCDIIRDCCIHSLTLCGDYGLKENVNKITKCLQNNTKFQLLKLKNITKEGLKPIFEVIILQKLDVSNNSLLDDGAATISYALKSNNTLLELNISENDITDKGSEEIAKATLINSSLQNISISKNYVSNEGLLYFMKAVKNSCSSQIVNITHNNVTGSGFTNIKQCIETLQRQIQISASWNEINSSGNLAVKIYKAGTPDITEEAAWSFDCNHLVACLTQCLKKDDISQKLNLYCKRITSEGAKQIAEAIQVNTALQKLDIHDNMISDGGTTAISDSLKSNNSLQEVNMSSNEITSEGAKNVGEAIYVNTTLQKLDISNNRISDDGVAAISDSLKTNNSLQELSVVNNQITSEGAKKIAEAIQVNSALQKLYINNNTIYDDGAAAISNGLKSNNSLQKLVMSDNKITREGAKTIA